MINKKLIYIAQGSFPSQAANTIQVTKQAEGFLLSAGLDVTIFGLMSDSYDKCDIYTHYNINNRIQFILFAPFFKRLKSLFYCIFLFKYIACLDRENTIIYSRFIPGAILSSLLGFKTKLELHAPVWDINILEVLYFNIFIFLEKDSIVFISKKLRDLYVSKFKNFNSIVLHDSASIQQFDRLKCDKKSLNVGYVGSLYEGKGVEIVLELARIHSKIMFYVIGGYEKQIIFLKNKYPDLINVFFSGFVNQKDLHKFYEKFEIALLPNQEKIYTDNSDRLKVNISEYTSPLKLFEYMSYGKTIISSKFPVLEEVLNENNSILVKSDSLSEWSNALTILTQDRELLEKLKRNSYNDFVKNHTWNIRADHILQYYNI